MRTYACACVPTEHKVLIKRQQLWGESVLKIIAPEIYVVLLFCEGVEPRHLTVPQCKGDPVGIEPLTPAGWIPCSVYQCSVRPDHKYFEAESQELIRRVQSCAELTEQSGQKHRGINISCDGSESHFDPFKVCVCVCVCVSVCASVCMCVCVCVLAV